MSRPEATVSLIQTDFKYEVFAFFDKFFPIIFFFLSVLNYEWFFFPPAYGFYVAIIFPEKKKKKRAIISRHFFLSVPDFVSWFHDFWLLVHNMMIKP